MPAFPDDLGDIVLFRHQNHMSENLIITAHGEHVNIFSSYNMHFQLPAGKTLHFYTPNHSPQTDFTLCAIANTSQAEYDIGKYVGPRQCANYRLYYYENDTIQDINTACNSAQTNYPDVAVIVANNGTSLKNVLNIIRTQRQQRYNNYTDIHCSFCRVGYQWLAHRLTPGRKAPSTPAFQMY